MFEPRISEDLLEDGRGGALHQRHFRWNERPESINNNISLLTWKSPESINNNISFVFFINFETP
jgi:hypothetical protein